MATLLIYYLYVLLYLAIGGGLLFITSLLFKDEDNKSKVSEQCFDALEFTLVMIILWPVTIPFLLIAALSEKL